METIRQNGKIILHGNDGISIKMIFRNLTGKNFQGKEYADYIRHIAINSMGPIIIPTREFFILSLLPAMMWSLLPASTVRSDP